MDRFFIPALFVADILVAASRLGPNDLGFDQNVVGAADHHQMFDIVTTDDDELALTVEIEGVDNAEPHLPGSPARHSEPAPKGEPKDQEHEDCGDENRHGGGGDHQTFVLGEKTIQGGHWPLVRCFAKFLRNSNTPDRKARGQG
ncbi:MAG TPA: hypothetical protein VIJ06_07680 [Methylovirgula sp.]